MVFSCNYPCQIFWLIIIGKEMDKDFSKSEERCSRNIVAWYLHNVENNLKFTDRWPLFARS